MTEQEQKQVADLLARVALTNPPLSHQSPCCGVLFAQAQRK